MAVVTENEYFLPNLEGFWESLIPFNVNNNGVFIIGYVLVVESDGVSLMIFDNSDDSAFCGCGLGNFFNFFFDFFLNNLANFLNLF